MFMAMSSVPLAALTIAVATNRVAASIAAAGRMTAAT
jgi:hypothetical protein